MSNYSPNTTPDEAYHLFKGELLKAINQTAPLKTIKCSDRQKHSWHNKFIKEQKRVVKNREKPSRKYKQDDHWQAYTTERNIYNRLFAYHKKTNTVKTLRTQTRTLKMFNLLNNLTSSKSSNPMPEGQTDVKLAEEIATFFLEKTENICDKFTGIEEFKPFTNEQVPLLKKCHHFPAMKYTRKYSV